jgi:hypothetical protein
LVENYVKGQKLALALWVNYRRKMIHSYYLKWFKISRQIKNAAMLDNLRKNMELIERMKSKIT